MLLTGDHDDRVSPGPHSFKHIATLQNTLPNNVNPFLMRVALKAGHGVSSTLWTRIAGDMLSFDL